jgi:decaprenylphospho-beta-D-erythro-pentofuranosid-2-ulose 2-reductase
VQNVLIVGATSAVASEVAALYARRGARLHLLGRSGAKMDALLARLDSQLVSAGLGDFTDYPNNAKLVAQAVAALGRIDVVLIAHGLLGDQLLSERDFEAARAQVEANYTSVLSFVIPLANHLESQGRGQIAVISSVAGDRGRPRNYTYGAAKGALTLYLQGLRSRLWPRVGVHTIKLGPVDSPMTVDHPKNALFATCPEAATQIVKVIEAKRQEAYVPWFWAPIMFGVRHLPEAVFQKLRFLSGR